jgi:glycosyltransferase involved in cell wall biosynthesis
MVPEVVEHGISGFIVDSVNEAVAAVRAASRLDRAGVRGAFEAGFTAERMAIDYLALYRCLPGLSGETRRAPAIMSGPGAGLYKVKP